MIFLGTVPETVELLLDRQRILNEKLMADFDGTCVLQTFSEQPCVLDSFDREQLGRIVSGSLIIVSKGVEVAIFETGDLVGLSRVFGLPHADLKAADDVEIELIHRDVFVDYVNQDSMRQHRWSNYLLTTSTLYQEVLSHFHVQVQVQPPKGFQQIRKGDVIIREGDQADTVYQLMSGSADVSVNGVGVGDIFEGEIFGAMAVFTGEPRNATVIAREDCQLLAIPKAQFVDLVRAQPETAISLLDNMSRRIKSLNDQVIKHQVRSA